MPTQTRPHARTHAIRLNPFILISIIIIYLFITTTTKYKNDPIIWVATVKVRSQSVSSEVNNLKQVSNK